MDEMAGVVQIIKIVSFFIGLGGLILGIDAILGAKMISAFNSFLSKTINFDKMIIGDPGRRTIIGIVFLVVSVSMILLIKKI